MGEAAKKLTDYDEKLVHSVPSPESYADKEDRKVVEAFKRLSPNKQAKILHMLGVTDQNPFSISGDMKSRVLDLVAQVGFGVESERRGASRVEISTPSGHGKRTK